MTRPQTQQKLIEAAMELFAFQGYANTGLAQISKKAGAQPGSLYHFYPTKEDLLAATLEERLTLLWPEVLQPIWDRIDDPLERVFGLLDGYRRMLQMTEFSHGCPIGNLAIELAETHPNTRPLIAANFDNWKRFVADCYRQAADRLPDDVDPDQLAQFTLVTMEGAVMLARTYRSFDAYDTAIATFRDYIERLVSAATSGEVPGARLAPRKDTTT
jgi:AcrR family transcriptional regulator